MENKFEHIEDIIAKFLAGEANAEEIALLEEWKNLSVENAREFRQYELLFNESAGIADSINVDTDVAWARVKKSLHENSPKGKVIRLSGPKQFPSLLRIAAILLLVAGLGVTIYFISERHENNFANISTTDSVKVVNLPDGSFLTLNQNSSVSYSSSSFSKERHVKLNGEGFFKVIHDSLSPFIVEAGDVQIKDIGTAFNVKARQGTNVIIVSVSEGEVQLTTDAGNSVFLSAGEEATYNLSERKIEMSEHFDKNISAYKDKIFIFENAQLSEVLKVLGEIYETDLQMSNENLQNCRLTVTFNDEQIDAIADVIAETLGLTLIKEPGKIIFSGDACK